MMVKSNRELALSYAFSYSTNPSGDPDGPIEDILTVAEKILVFLEADEVRE